MTLNVHIATVHEGKKSFGCDVCHYLTTQHGHLNVHIDTVHEGKKSFGCDVCDKNSHIASVHEGKKAFKYDVSFFAYIHTNSIPILNTWLKDVHIDAKIEKSFF